MPALLRGTGPGPRMLLSSTRLRSPAVVLSLPFPGTLNRNGLEMMCARPTQRHVLAIDLFGLHSESNFGQRFEL